VASYDAASNVCPALVSRGEVEAGKEGAAVAAAAMEQELKAGGLTLNP
jgi:hypothetical protein